MLLVLICYIYIMSRENNLRNKRYLGGNLGLSRKIIRAIMTNRLIAEAIYKVAHQI